MSMSYHNYRSWLEAITATEDPEKRKNRLREFMTVILKDPNISDSDFEILFGAAYLSLKEVEGWN